MSQKSSPEDINTDVSGNPVENTVVSSDSPVVKEGEQQDGIPQATPPADDSQSGANAPKKDGIPAEVPQHGDDESDKSSLGQDGASQGGAGGDGGDSGDETTPLIIPSRGTLPNERTNWFHQPQYILFSNELKNIKKSNLIILKECKEAKRLLDLKFGDLTNIINRIQTSVILLSTISGFFNATKQQFGLSEEIISVASISISTYVSLILSISKYFKYDESKEGIQSLRDKYSLLHNQIEHRMDVLGPWNDPNLWIFSDPDVKLREWDEVKAQMHKEYVQIINNKKALTTEFEVTMDTKSRNAYHITNKQLTYDNRVKLFGWAKKEMDLEDVIESEYDRRDEKKRQRKKALIENAVASGTSRPKLHRRHSLFSNHEVMEDNWDDESEQASSV
jgi:hypothetical protein